MILNLTNQKTGFDQSLKTEDRQKTKSYDFSFLLI